MAFHQMNRPERIVVVLYCLLMVYCSVWIPWQEPARRVGETLRPAYNIGYGWLWVVPAMFAAPDFQRIALRFVAATALSAGLFVIAGLRK